ncbi:DUF1559 domain-containing protein [Neorhodopirellula pilleata]|uniref:DUF1559 domain-containing protein n=1 Tax=Neorhodopirellula pilleata TaxID=2714738 RepID=A0A5C6B0J8_9BACT|nr:DUF1559 domain-containing protein [Neorhodopirellula pilleata]TWU03944.1 hypothetical protein Pla100_08800 [Neorhodopirellula pilleata]
MKTQRSGFTLVELLVVITIIGILMGLLIPAVNAARETARRNQCSTQVKNLALAAIQFENAKGELPGYAQVFGFYETPAAAPFDPTDPTATAGAARHVKLGSWVVSLLPWLDAQPTYEHWTEDRYPILDSTGGEFEATSGQAGEGFHQLASPNLAIMQCPSNPNDDSANGRNSYISNNGLRSFNNSASSGGGTVNFEDAMDRANGAFNNKFAGVTAVGPPIERAPIGPKVRLDDFKDGQGNTILFSENVQAMPWHRVGFLYDAAADTDLTPTGAAPSQDITFSVGNGGTYASFTQGMVWHYEDKDSASTTYAWSNGSPSAINKKHLINGGGNSVAEDIFVEQMTAANAEDLARPSSAHTDGVNCGMADGGTRFVADSIDYRVYQALLTPRGKSSDVPWPEFILDDDAY